MGCPAPALPREKHFHVVILCDWSVPSAKEVGETLRDALLAAFAEAHVSVPDASAAVAAVGSARCVMLFLTRNLIKARCARRHPALACSTL